MKALQILLLLASSFHCVAGDLTAKDAFKAFLNRNDYKGGVAALEREIAAHPADVRLLVGLGQLHSCFEKYAEAKAALDRALSVDPAHAVAHNYMGKILFEQGKPTEALKHLDLAIKSNPTYADAHFNRAVVLMCDNPPNKTAARESYKRAISLGCSTDIQMEELLK